MPVAKTIVYPASTRSAPAAFAAVGRANAARQAADTAARRAEQPDGQEGSNPFLVPGGEPFSFDLDSDLPESERTPPLATTSWAAQTRPDQP